MEPAINKRVTPNSPLLEVRELFDTNNIEYLPIIDQAGEVISFIERKSMDRYVSTKLIEAEQKAVSLG